MKEEGMAGAAILEAARGLREEILAFVQELARRESPSDVPESQEWAQALLWEALEGVGFQLRRIRGRSSGGILMARPRKRERGRPLQLLLGHSDTVWPLGTLETMPVTLEEGRVRGPGVWDMKGGLTQMVFALRILRELGLEPPATPVVLVNSDEEVGSPESKRTIVRLSRRVVRAFIPEPPLGPEGKLKTVRKGVGRFTFVVRGKAAHAGLNPEAGASAILELSHLIQALHALNEPERGITVNVGVVSGGLRPNVIAPGARAEVDLRVLTTRDGEEAGARIRAIRPVVPGVSLEVEGGIIMPPLERTSRNQALVAAALRAGAEMGLHLEEGVAGGGSDGNTTSQYTATLDGLGAVGDGAHASHEHLVADSLVERCALLARLLLLEP